MLLSKVRSQLKKLNSAALDF